MTAASGCGSDRPETLPVRGKVLLDGQPLTHGTITFFPEEGRSSFGRIQPDGTYTLTTYEEGDGALVGKHTVTVEAVEITGGGQQPTSLEEEIAITKSGKDFPWRNASAQRLVPKAYSSRQSTPLTAEVTADGDNSLNFMLTRP